MNKKYLLSFALSALVVAGLGLLTAADANAQTVEPVISNVTVNPSPTDATINWSTDEAANSQIEYGTSTDDYTASTTLDTNQVTEHSEMLSGLMPDTTYYYQVISVDASGNMNYSPGASFMTTNAMSTTSTSTEPMISSVIAMPTADGATVTWNTDEPSNSQIEYGTTSGSYTASTTLDTNSVMSHSESISGLEPNTTYYFVVMDTDGSQNMNISPEQMFTTLASSTTGTGSTSTSTSPMTIAQLESELDQLESELAALISEFNLTWSGSGYTTGTTSSTGTNTGSVSNTAMIDQNDESVRAGTSP